MSSDDGAGSGGAGAATRQRAKKRPAKPTKAKPTKAKPTDAAAAGAKAKKRKKTSKAAAKRAAKVTATKGKSAPAPEVASAAASPVTIAAAPATSAAPPARPVKARRPVVRAPTEIKIRGARTHNLQGIDLDIPRDELVVITGPSGSGKSSLAYDTIFAEGQRRYVESLSASARIFLAQLPKPDADLIEGLSPAIALEQTTGGKSPRATVGTATEIYDYLRLLYARVGEVYSHVTGAPMRRHSVEEMVEATLALPERSRFSVIAPVARQRPGDHRELLDELRRQGFVRVAIDDEVRDLAEPIELDPNVRHDVEVYVDRLVLKDGIRGRLADSIEVALRLSGGHLKVLCLDGQELRFSEHYTDFASDLSYPPLTPALFSFNNPEGACPECGGLGERRILDPRRIVPNDRLSLRDGAIRPWHKRGARALLRQLEAVADHFDIDMGAPWADLREEHKVILMQGSGDEVIPGLGKPRGKGKKSGRARGSAGDGKPFEGVIPALMRGLEEGAGKRSKEEDADASDDDGELTELSDSGDLAEYMSDVPCPTCAGQRLRLEARMVKLGGRNIADLAALPLRELAGVLEALDLPAEDGEIAEAILGQARQRLHFMLELGLDYLTLDRPTLTLSGGEAQRIRLATQIGAALVGVTYILDEPSIGLHQRDNDRLIAALEQLRDLGNSVLVVEHDEETIRAADYVIDMGPQAGVHGGQVVAAGRLAEVLRDPRSLTAAYLTGRLTIPRSKRRRRGAGVAVEIRGARGHNLKGLSAKIPVGALTVVSGVSGSGKSTLILDTLLAEAKRRLSGASTFGLAHESIRGLHHLDKVIDVDQSPIGRSPRSNPATYTGVFTDLRGLYAGLTEAKIRGYTAARFSFNVKGGRCEACQGEGVRRIEMHFLPDIYVTCRACEGRRYNRETLAVTYRGKSIADVLDTPIADACDFFHNHPNLRQKLETLRDVGLGYLTLGQSALTLSGGEAQRIKLAKELAKKSTGKTLFILDEPTTGLHFADIAVLLGVFDRLVDEGNTVVVIEHNLDVLAHADHVLDIGPEGGDGGGELVASGPPEIVAQVAASHTGRYLARHLGL
ncbi:MAG: excinuclease ABC subunit UvrA [Nannocystaceae bacterium]